MNEAGRADSPEGLLSLATLNATFSVLARASGILVGILLTPYVLGRIGRELYGIVVGTIAAFDYLLLLHGGIGTALRRHVTILAHSGSTDQARRHYASGFWWGNLARLVILALTVLFAGVFCRFLRLPETVIADGSRGVFLIIVAMIVSDLTGTFDVPIYATGRLHRIRAVYAVSPWIRLLVLLTAFRLFIPSLTVYGGSLVLAEIPAMVVLALMAQRSGVAGPALPRPTLGDATVRREMLGYGGIAMLSQIALLLYISTDHMLIGRIYGPAAVTHYSLGVRWEPLIRGLLWMPIVALAPLFTQMEARQEGDRSRQAVRRAVALSATIAVPTCLVPCIIGDLFLGYWVGEEYRGSARYLIAVVAPSCLTISLAPVWAALFGRGRIGWIAVGDLMVAIVNVAVSLLLALGVGLGLLGFALGNTVALFLKNLLLIPLAARRDQVIPRARDLLLPIPRALIGAAPGLVALFLLRGFYDRGLVPVIIAGVLGGSIALIGAVSTTVGWREVCNVLRSLPGLHATGEL